MATDRKLRVALLRQLGGVTPQALSQRVKRIQATCGPMSTEDAVYVIAHKEGLKLQKYLPPETVDRIRTIVQNHANPAVVALGGRQQHSDRRASRPVPRGQMPRVDALLSTTIEGDAHAMAGLYPKYYILENSLRIVIKRILDGRHGKQWWNTKVPVGVRKTVEQRRTDETKKPWHGKRGQHEVFYSDFKDLSAIIQQNWDDFRDFFPSRPWITQKLEELEHPRNVLAHHNPVSANDLRRVDVYFNDWISLLHSKEAVIPQEA